MSSSATVDLSTLFPFQLDAFQQDAIAALNAGQSVVVVAPTGSGKTLVGEYAIARALAQGQRVFYTTPLKALSNQKLRDFRAQFGEGNVGLLTGDVSINRTAPILVMTTEIFRNILYGTLVDELETSLDLVAAVVLDECHYMNDRQRGTVWEEAIIYCPPEIQLIALSATIANAGQLTDWINWVHGSTQLVDSTWRPVPLCFHFGTAQGLFPLLNRQQTKLNPRLRTVPSKQPKGSGRSRRSRSVAPPPRTIIEALQAREMLPAIYFLFSRRGCDKAVEATQGLTVLTPTESQQLEQHLDQFLKSYPDLARSPILGGIRRGIAAHHAGLLPAWKSLTEELFQQGLVKVIFATETLAAGINMPARTTIISSLSKRTDLGHRLLTASEFLQMAGRAGRRGMDSLGHVVTLQTAFEGPKEAAYLATIGADPLVSQFTPSYGMVLNLLQTRTLEEAKALIERSFGQYIAMQQLAPQQQAIDDLAREIEAAQVKLSTVNLADIQQYNKLKGRLKEEQRLLKILEHQAQENRLRELVPRLEQMIPGTLLTVKTHPGAKSPAPVPDPQFILSAVFVKSTPGHGQIPHYISFCQNNTWLVVTHRDILAIHPESPMTVTALLAEIPSEWPQKNQRFHTGEPHTATLGEKLPPPAWAPEPEVIAQQQRVEAVQTQLETHPAHANRKHHGTLLRLEHRVERLQNQLCDRQTKLNHQMHQRWQDFLCLVTILQHFAALEDLCPTPLGKTAALLRGENELWLALALRSGSLDRLAPHHFAAVCAALVSENNRSDSWSHHSISPAVQEALTALRPIRRQLIQSQYREGTAIPVWLETELIGIVEQWALDTPWTDLCASISLDEGDIVRLLRRTVDLLSQIPHIPYLSEELRLNARRAVALIDRFPINELQSLPQNPAP